MTTVVVSGAMATKARNSGNAWSRLGWIEGLRSLGFDCWLVEQVPGSGLAAADRAWFEAVVRAHGLADRSLLVDATGAVQHGAHRSLPRLLRTAAMVLNISGHLGREQLEHCSGPVVFVDDDPGFTQSWEASGSSGSKLDGHDVFFTYGTNLGADDCPIPTVGRQWHTTVPPVWLPDWPVLPVARADRFTTVGTWRGPFGAVELAGITYGLKVHEFRKVMELPKRIPAEFEIALDIDPSEVGDLQRLADAGWRVVNPRSVIPLTGDYRRWIQGSAAEFAPAQGVYAGTNSGWVSDRTACYLASGRPAVVQDTGLGRTIPTGEGLLTFSCLPDAVMQVAEVRDDYQRHATAARKLAQEWFDATLVARQVCTTAGVAP